MYPQNWSDVVSRLEHAIEWRRKYALTRFEVLEYTQRGRQVRMTLGVALCVTALLDILTRLLKYYSDCMYHVNMYSNICDLLCL